MKTFTSLSSLLTLTLMVISLKPRLVISTIEDICKMKDEDLQASRAFTMFNDLYLGNDLYYWKVTVNEKDITADKNETIGTIFGNTRLKRIVTAVHFGTVPGGAAQQIPKAKDLLIVIGCLDDRGTQFGYKAYRALLNQYPGVIDDDKKMPWTLKIEGLMTGHFWPENQDYYSGATFDAESKTLYTMSGMADGNNVNWSIQCHSVDANNNFPKNFTIFHIQKIYTALIGWKNKIFGLIDNKFYRLGFSGTDVIEEEEFTIKKFLNCDQKSPLLELSSNTNITLDLNNSTDIPAPADNTTDTIVQQSSGSETVSSAVQTDTSPVTEATVATTKGKESSSLLWIIIVIVIILIIIAIIIALLCLCKGKKGDEEKNAEKSGLAANVQSEGASKSSSKVGDATAGAKGGPGGPGGPGLGSSIGSSTGSVRSSTGSVGSGSGSGSGSGAGLKKTSSSLESKASVRSVH